MTQRSSAYTGRTVTFATMHGKELLARDAFRHILGAIVTTPRALDTDQFGTFSGEIARTLTPIAAARAKAHLGMETDATSLALASEGSFSGGPGIGVEHVELLLFLDIDRGLELVETTITTSLIPGGRTVESIEEATDYAHAIGFPNQGVIVHGSGPGGKLVRKNLVTLTALADAVSSLLAGPVTQSVTVEPDLRAHRTPTRAVVIRSLAVRMAERLAIGCPTCGTPGFGRIDVERGLPCAECGAPTTAIAADVNGCGTCATVQRIPRATTSVTPEWCDFCNP